MFTSSFPTSQLKQEQTVDDNQRASWLFAQKKNKLVLFGHASLRFNVL